MVSVLVVLACCGAALASPAARFRREAVPMPDGIPLEALFEACGGELDNGDVGPCLQDLLSGTIDLAKPSFATGVELPGGKTKVLEPLSLKDVPMKPGKKFQFSLKNLKVHGLSTVQVQEVTLSPTRLGLRLSFEHLRASTNLRLKYLFITGDSQAQLELLRPSVRVDAGWTLAATDGKLSLQLVNPQVDVAIEDLSIQLTALGGLGGFLQSVVNNNSNILLEILVPELERQATEKLANELGNIKLASGGFSG